MTTKQFRISEDDLAILESELPRIMELSDCNHGPTRKRWEAVKEIVCNIRWDYGPPIESIYIPAESED